MGNCIPLQVLYRFSFWDPSTSPPAHELKKEEEAEKKEFKIPQLFHSLRVGSSRAPVCPATTAAAAARGSDGGCRSETDVSATVLRQSLIRELVERQMLMSTTNNKYNSDSLIATPCLPQAQPRQTHRSSDSGLGSYTKRKEDCSGIKKCAIQEPNKSEEISQWKERLFISAPLNKKLRAFRRSSMRLRLTKPVIQQKLWKRVTSEAEPSPPIRCSSAVVKLKRSNNVMVRHRRLIRQLSRSGSVTGNRPVPGAADKQHWWYNIGRQTAERLLLQPNQSKGTFLLRPSSEENVVALSLKTADGGNGNGVVKHYRIKFDVPQNVFYLSKKSTYPTLLQFITQHQKTAGGLPCCLTMPMGDEAMTTQFVDFEVNRNSIVLHRRIGCGSFGEVWLATRDILTSDDSSSVNSDQPRNGGSGFVAVKRLLDTTGNLVNRRRFLEEAEIMRHLHHEHIVRLLGVSSEPPSQALLIITELMARGSLKFFLQGNQSFDLTFQQLITMMTQIADGMSYLERQNFLHRDLRSSNVLVAENLKVKVADFGLAHMLGDKDEYCGNSETKFPIRWTAPEGITRQVYSTKSDVWSFGVLMHEMVTRCEQPFLGMTSMEVRQVVVTGYQLPRPFLRLNTAQIGENTEGEPTFPLCPLPLYNLMKQCWNFIPLNRPTFQRLLQHLSTQCFEDVEQSETGSSEEEYADLEPAYFNV